MEQDIVIELLPQIKRADNQKWQKFVEVLALVLGVGFLLSGIIFFFAYNWDGLHRFVKMGIVLALLLATFAAVVKVPMRDWIRNITIFALCILVGAFLAVYGQVYQTGADSYLLFLGWSLCIVVWVVVADFYPLWLFFMSLVILTYGLIPTVKFNLFDYLIIFSIFTVFFEFAPKFIPNKSIAPKWFMTLLICTLSILAVTIFIFQEEFVSPVLLVVIAIYGLTGFYSYEKKNLLGYSVFCIGILILVYKLFIKMIGYYESMVFITLPFMVAIYFLGKHIIDKKKKWESVSDEESMSTENLDK